MIYQWKQGRFGIDAQVAGEELERIAHKHDRLTQSDIVDESRPKNATLHKCFEWDNYTAAEKYREVQAGEILRSILTVSVDGKTEHEPLRAFVNIQEDYKPLSVVIATPVYRDEMFVKALRELRSFQSKYRSLEQLTGVFAEIGKLGA